MVALDEVGGSLLQSPRDEIRAAPERIESKYEPLGTFVLPKQRTYQQQYADVYFLRLTKIRPSVERVATAAWEGTVIGGEKARKAERVLDVRQGELCWVVGTVYFDMPLKPNILEDISKDRWISAPISVRQYFSTDEDRDAIYLEDDSGRIRLVGDALESRVLATGCIMAVLGVENADGHLEVVDFKFPDLPPQPPRWELSGPHGTGNGVAKGKRGGKTGEAVPKERDVEMKDGGGSGSGGGKIALVSGLEFSGADPSYAMELELLLEYLLGEALDPAAQRELSQVSRLIIAGNSIAAGGKAQEAAEEDTVADESEKRVPASKKYGYDSSAYNPEPFQLLDGFLSELLPSLPVTLLPGASDPANTSFPQQPIHSAIFGGARPYGPAAPAVPPSDDNNGSSSGPQPGWFDSVTNPWEGEVEGWRFLGTGGQNVEDMAKYVASDDRLGMMEAMCRWRISAPTAPDTLWAYPFQDDEPFVMSACPHVYFVGCQPEFDTKTIYGTEGQAIRLVAVPSFSSTREVVLIDSETLDVTKVKISVAGPS